MRASLVTVVFLGLAVAEVFGGASVVELPGPFRFRVGDDIAWAEPQYEDVDWREIQVPGGWVSQGFANRPYVGWYRTSFRWDSQTVRQPAILLGPIRSAYEVFLNGEKIGGAGAIDDRFFWGPEPRPRVFSIPQGLLRSDVDNVLSLRVQRIVTDGGLRSRQLGIGEEVDLRLEVERPLYVTLAWEAAFLMFYGSTLLFSGILWLLGFRDARHFWFAIVILQIGLSHLGNSNIIESVVGISYGWVVLVVLAEQCFPFSTLMFLKHTFQKEFGFQLRVALGVYAILCISWWWNIHTINVLYYWWSLIATFIFGPIGLAWCLEGRRRGHPDALPLLLGSGGLIVLLAGYYAWSISVLIEGHEGYYRAWFVPHEWYAWLCLHLSMIYTLASGYERARRRLRTMSIGVLQAHEEERRRVARDLHDGIGQILSSLKLRLDALSSQWNHSQPELAKQMNQSAREADQAFDELRRVTSDLRPEALQRLGLVDAVRDLGQRSVHGGPQVCVHADGGLDAGAVAGADHIYRVIQEAISNAVRHGGATLIDIDFRRVKQKLFVTIEDNGQGFGARSPDLERAEGVGLTSMRERVQLLGGKLHVSTDDKSGTTITLENLPL